MTTSQSGIFVSHGSPMAVVETGAFQDALKNFGASVTPSAILVISAHWDSGRTISITSGERNTLIYDFGGFPLELYELQYDAPGSPPLANQVADILHSQFEVSLDPNRGLDHGAWVPLRLMFPSANIPVIELSIPTSLSPQDLFQIGSLLRPLRQRGILILGSGGIVHNLRTVDFRNQHGPAQSWAADFDRWFAESLATRNYEALFEYHSVPNARLAVPTPEHFVPVFVVLGAAENTSALATIYEGFEYGTLSMRSFSLS